MLLLSGIKQKVISYHKKYSLNNSSKSLNMLIKTFFVDSSKVDSQCLELV